jgi:hypothetical protein
MEYEVKVIEYIAYEKIIYVEADNKKQARKKAKNQDWFDAGPDGVCVDQAVKKVLTIKNINK